MNNSKNIKESVVSVIRIVFVCALLIPLQAAVAQNQTEVVAGEQVFQTYCLACHSVGEGARIGPDLAAVHERRSQDWLQRFIRSPKTVFDSGDRDAIELFATYNGFVMPDSTISDQQIRETLSYIQSRSISVASSPSLNPVADTAANTVVEDEPASPAEIAAGADLFQGKRRFSNSGPACNACHDISSDAVTGGGALAVELTSAYSRMGSGGLAAIIGQAPFPAMQMAYRDSPLEGEEVSSLVAFLQDAEAQSEFQQQKNYGLRLFITGALGASFLFGLIPFIWRGRRIGSVNQSIYDRQHKL